MWTIGTRWLPLVLWLFMIWGSALDVSHGAPGLPSVPDELVASAGAAGVLGSLVYRVPEGIARTREFLSPGQAGTAASALDWLCRSPVKCRGVHQATA